MKRETYREMCERQQKEFNEFTEKHCFYAFSHEQYEEGMRKIGLDPVTDTDKVAFGPGGMYYCCDTTEAEDIIRGMTQRHELELNAAIEADKTGKGFVREMFLQEMRDHEFTYTGDLEDTLDALDLTIVGVAQSEKLTAGAIAAGIQLGMEDTVRNTLLAAALSSDATIWSAISIMREVYKEDPDVLQDMARQLPAIFGDMVPKHAEDMTRAILAAVIYPDREKID